MPPLISVLTPTYNRPDLLKGAVESVLAQTFDDFELIVVNDGGQDVRALLDGFHDKRIVYLPLEANSGKAHALNRGLEPARGKYLAFLDDDDRFYAHHLETLQKEIEAHPEADLVYSDFEEVLYEKEEGGQRRETDRLIKYSAEFDRVALFKENYIPHPTILARREALQRIGGFDESYPCLIDWELFHRLAFYSDFHHVRAVTGEYFINRERGDHITNLFNTRREFYMEHFYRVRRQLPPRPWSKVVPITLLIRYRSDGVDLTTFLSRLLFSTYYPGEIYVLYDPEKDDLQGLPQADWLEKMNVVVLPVGADPDHIQNAAQQSFGELIVTLDTAFTPYNGWLYPLLERWKKQGSTKPIKLGYWSSNSPWGWLLSRADALQGLQPWEESTPCSAQQSADVQVSVIIPVRNKKKYTEQCLASIKMTNPLIRHEIIVVDNASDDGSQELLQELSEKGMLTWLRNDPPLPFAASCNRGAAAARGKFLLFLNNDTIALPGWLEELHRQAIQAPDVGAVGAKLLFPDNSIQHAGVAFHRFRRNNVVNPYHIFRCFPKDHPAVSKVREYQVITGACLMTPKAVFDDLGGFDEKFINCFEDVDYCLNLRSRGYRVIYTPHAELVHFEGQTPGRNDHVLPSRIYLQEKWGDLMKPDEQNYLPEDGFNIYENDVGMIFIIADEEMHQWRGAISQLIEMREWLMALEEIDRLEQVIGTVDPYIQELHGHCALGLGDVGRAKLAFYKAQTLNPDSIEARWGLALVAIAAQKPLEAKSRLRRLIDDFPQDHRQAIWQHRLEDIREIEGQLIAEKHAPEETLADWMARR